jgi:hypothetical protein
MDSFVAATPASTFIVHPLPFPNLMSCVDFRVRASPCSNLQPPIDRHLPRTCLVSPSGTLAP